MSKHGKKRSTIIAGNWKMHKTHAEGMELIDGVLEHLPDTDAEAVFGVPAYLLKFAAERTKDFARVQVAAQNCHFEDSGAYTGELSPHALAAMDVKYVILGHSERREYFGEDEALLAKKVDAALRNGLHPIFCIGEKLEVREANEHEALVEKQIRDALFHLSAEDFGRVVLAYEPVWAIGTGKTASPEQAQQMHAHIRRLVRDQYGEATADALTIQYGGSMKPANAAELLAQPDVDGGLVGGASLRVDTFTGILERA